MSTAPASRAGGAVVALASALCVLVSCGIAGDDSPRALAVSTTTTEPASSPTSGGASAVAYYVFNDHLIPVTVSLPDQETGTVLHALLEAPDGSNGNAVLAGLSTAIPTGTELRNISLDGDTLTVDLSSDFENLAGPVRQQAIGQMVLTATESPSINQLRFSINGRPLLVTSPTRGDTESVDACDFAQLLPTAEEAEAASLDEATLDRLDLRRSELERLCPRPSTTLP